MLSFGSDDAFQMPEGVLACPACGNEWTHVDAVQAVVREGEDGKPHSVTLFASGKLTEPEPGHSPVFGDTGRRHEFTLSAWCETCGADWFITFRQHKGQTLVALRVNGGPDVQSGR